MKSTCTLDVMEQWDKVNEVADRMRLEGDFESR